MDLVITEKSKKQANNMNNIKQEVERELVMLRDFFRAYKTDERKEILSRFLEVRRHYYNYHKFINRNHKELRPSRHLLRNKKTFENTYKSGTVFQVKFNELRYSITLACLICGVPRNGQLDHFLPISNFPQFAVFLHNLVPVCGECNSSKGNIEGHLHPVFSKWMKTNFLQLEIVNFFDGKPTFTLSGNKRLDFPSRKRFGQFATAAEIRRKILRFCEMFWYEYTEKELTTGIIFQSPGNFNLVMTIENLTQQLKEKSVFEFNNNGTHSAAGMLYNALANCPDLLDYVVKRRLAAKLASNATVAFKIYGLNI
jgi:5-methylcytosine-specific restriction endonuclease McrA